jgi:2-dehydropantoate 2-reductase
VDVCVYASWFSLLGSRSCSTRTPAPLSSSSDRLTPAGHVKDANVNTNQEARTQQREPQSFMKIVVFGAGGVGAFFGGLLVRGGADVHFVARGPQLEALRTSGILIRSLRLGDIQIPPVHAESDTARVGICDLVLVCVKAQQTPDILDSVSALVGEQTTIVTLQNGVESDEPLAARFGAARVVPGVVYVGATLDEPGVVSHVAAGTIAIGVRDNGDPSRLPVVAAALRQTGQPVNIVDNIQQERWLKLLWNASFNPVSAITGKTPRELVGVRTTRQLIVGLMHEVTAVAGAQGIVLADSAIEEQLAWTEHAPAIRTSMMVDRKRGRGMEIEALVGVVVRKGRQHHVPTPFSQSMYALLEAIAAEPMPQPPPSWVPPPVHG